MSANTVKNCTWRRTTLIGIYNLVRTKKKLVTFGKGRPDFIRPERIINSVRAEIKLYRKFRKHGE